MSLDVVICTYNRPQKVVELITQLQDCIIAPSQIIVVDSSDKTNTDLRNKSGIKYIQSNHKNQPYQRFLGVNQSTSEYILFLDDDMEILDEHVRGNPLVVIQDDLCSLSEQDQFAVEDQ